MLLMIVAGSLPRAPRTPPSRNSSPRSGRRRRPPASRARRSMPRRAASSPTTKLPDLILPGRPATGAPSQAEFVQVPADYIKEASIARLAEHGQKLMQQYRPSLDAIESRFGVPATDRARDLGPRDRLRPLHAALRSDPRAGDAGLCRPAQGEISRRVHPRPEDAERRRGDAQGSALVLGRRHRAHAIPAVGLSTRTASISTATARSISGIRCRMRSPPPRSSSSTRAGRAACAGPMR